MATKTSNMAPLLARSGVVAIVAAILLGPFFSHPDYSSISHTISELAGQNMPNAWIMRAGFTLFGIGTAGAAALAWGRPKIERIPFFAFGLCFVGVALFSHVHIHPEQGNDLTEDLWHTIFASAIGASFTLACLACLFGPSGDRRDMLAWAGLVAALLIPLAMVSFPGVAGALQRAMFALSFCLVWTRFRS